MIHPCFSSHFFSIPLFFTFLHPILTPLPALRMVARTRSREEGRKVAKRWDNACSVWLNNRGGRRVKKIHVPGAWREIHGYDLSPQQNLHVGVSHPTARNNEGPKLRFQPTFSILSPWAGTQGCPIRSPRQGRE